MIKITEMGIANFKPFGEKVQRFKLKPITLVYGPNSIGKSSIIHSIAYQQNLYKTTNFSPVEMEFGDTISIGGFEQFVHKKDIDKHIHLEYTIDDKIEHPIDNLRTNGYTSADKRLLLSYTADEINKALISICQDINDDVRDEDSYHVKEFNDSDNFAIKWLVETREIEDYYTITNFKNFLDSASDDTKQFIAQADDLCSVATQENGDKLLVDFDEDVFSDIFLAADSATQLIFVDDLKRFFDQEYKDANDTAIRISTEIGFDDNKKLYDLNTQYFIGDEIVLSAKRNDGRYKLILNTSHWFIQLVIGNIRYYGGWDDGTCDMEEYIDEYIECNIPQVVNNDSIIFDCKSKGKSNDYYDDNPVGILSEWNCEIEKGLKSDLDKYCEKLHREGELFTNNAKKVGSKKFFGVATQLLDLIEEYNVTSLNDAIFFIAYSWICAVNESLNNTRELRYIGPLRFLPERYEFSFSNKLSQLDDSESVWHQLKDNKDIQKKLNKWLSSEKFKTSYELKVQRHITLNETNLNKLSSIIESRPENLEDEIAKHIQYIDEFSFYDKRYNTPVNIREMGLGISQVLPILVNLFQQKNKIIAVEQPELHLHPAIQSDLADEFILSYKNNNNYSILETHSEHLLLRIMRRMRQTSEGTLEDKELALTPDDVSLLYIDADNDKTYILELELAEDGSLLDPWPGGFFEEGFRERFL